MRINREIHGILERVMKQCHDGGFDGSRMYQKVSNFGLGRRSTKQTYYLDLHVNTGTRTLLSTS